MGRTYGAWRVRTLLRRRFVLAIGGLVWGYFRGRQPAPTSVIAP